RLAYLFAMNREFVKAAIACLGLRRIAESADSDQLHYKALYLAAWILKQMDGPDDLLMPRAAAEIRDISALSQVVEAQHVSEWRKNDESRIKSLFQISGIFELGRRYRRALSLFERARKKAEGDSNKTELFFFVNGRTARLQLLLHRTSVAVSLFRSVINHN